jgi:hypothetical protein
MCDIESGYYGRLFGYTNLFWSPGVYYCAIYRRAPSGFGWGTGKFSNKISIDRDSSHVYCTTLGIGTKAADYWRVKSDLSEVLLIEQSVASGVYGGVHSPEPSGVYLYGLIRDSIVERSKDWGITCAGLGAPTGLATEATTLYSLRSSNLPDNILITVTISGQTDSDIYSYPWNLNATADILAESQVRISGHNFIGALLPSSVIVQYSDDDFIWVQRDTGLPTVTITDLEFA